MVNTEGRALYYLDDATGYVRQGADDQGAVVSAWTFGPDGLVLEGPEGPVSHLVCKGIYDWSTGLIYKDRRYFALRFAQGACANPTLGIWLALAPLVVLQSWRRRKRKRWWYPWYVVVMGVMGVGGMLVECTGTPTGSPTGTATATATCTVSPAATNTPGPPTATPTGTPTSTPTSTPTNTPRPTDTPVPPTPTSAVEVKAIQDMAIMVFWEQRPSKEAMRGAAHVLWNDASHDINLVYTKVSSGKYYGYSKGLPSDTLLGDEGEKKLWKLAQEIAKGVIRGEGIYKTDITGGALYFANVLKTEEKVYKETLAYVLQVE